jgi:predicted transposase YdaD
MAGPPIRPHDALFKWAFGVVENARPELRAALPPALSGRLDWASLRVCSGSFLDKILSDSHCDLLYSIALSDRPERLYVLFEHQSSIDPPLALRLLSYVVRVLEQHMRDNRAQPLPLPLVLPVVLHHSGTGWTAAWTSEDLFGPGLLQLPGVGPVVPRMGFFLDDISHLSDRELLQRALGHVPTLTLWALRDSRNPPALLRSLPDMIPTIRALAQAPGGLEALATIFHHILRVADETTAHQIRLAILQNAPQAEGAIMTAAEKLIAEGELKGRAEGEIKGRADLLSRQMTLKFGHLPKATRDLLFAASKEDLDRWAERVLTAASLDEVISR